MTLGLGKGVSYMRKERQDGQSKQGDGKSIGRKQSEHQGREPAHEKPHPHRGYTDGRQDNRPESQ